MLTIDIVSKVGELHLPAVRRLGAEGRLLVAQ